MATESLDKSLSRISEKMHVLAQRYDTVCQERTQALERIAELERELRDKEQRIEQLSLRNEYLSVSSTLAPDRDAIEKTRNIITELVREIDRCIADIRSSVAGHSRHDAATMAGAFSIMERAAGQLERVTQHPSADADDADAHALVDAALDARRLVDHWRTAFTDLRP